MACMLKNYIGGGIISRSVKLQVFLEPKLYLELVNELKVLKVIAKNDSDMINKIIVMFLHNLGDISILQMEIERLKTAIAKKNVALDLFMEKKKVKK